jgi:hypothetical protein
MTIGVSHDLDTGNVVLIDAAAQTTYELTPSKAHQLASKLRAAAASGQLILVVADAEDGRQVRIGGAAADAMVMGDDLDRNAELGLAIRRQKAAP